MRFLILLFAIVFVTKDLYASSVSADRMYQAKNGCLIALQEYYGKLGENSPGARECKKEAGKYYTQAESESNSANKIELYKKCFIAGRSSNVDVKGREKCSNCTIKYVIDNSTSGLLRCEPSELNVFNTNVQLKDTDVIMSKEGKLGSLHTTISSLEEEKSTADLDSVKKKLAPVTAVLCPIIKDIERSNKTKNEKDSLMSAAFTFLRDKIGTTIMMKIKILGKKQADTKILEKDLEKKLTDASATISNMKPKLLKDLGTDSGGFLTHIFTIVRDIRSEVSGGVDCAVYGTQVPITAD